MTIGRNAVSQGPRRLARRGTRRVCRRSCCRAFRLGQAAVVVYGDVKVVVADPWPALGPPQTRAGSPLGSLRVPAPTVGTLPSFFTSKCPDRRIRSALGAVPANPA